MPRKKYGAAEPSIVRQGLEKRKACDLCHIKKIKCDAIKPVCSHCIVYGAQCTYTPHIKKRRKEVQVQKNVAITLTLNEEKSTSEHREERLRRVPIVQDRISSSGGSSIPNLPSIDDLLPIIQDYFANLNIIIPLFDRGPYMAMIDNFKDTNSQNPMIIAAINVILALTYQYRATEQYPIPGFDQLAYTSNIQHLLNGQDSGQSDLLTLQVLLGLVVLHLGTPHPGLSTASSFMGSAIKLAHRLQLHRKKANDLFDTKTSLQRVRLFWIAYILDRDISLRTHEPPLLQERDHNIEIPPSTKESGLIRFVSENGGEHDFDLFQAWIHISNIQGKIYEELYSVRAEDSSPETQQHAREEIHGLLTDWLKDIPAEIHPNKLVRVYPKPAVAQLISLYFTRMACFLHTHKVGTNDAEWVIRLINYSQELVKSTGSELVAETAADTAPSPFLEPTPAWPEVVQAARECATLFRLVDMEDSRLRWSVSCTYVSATIVLIANILTVSEHGHESGAMADEKLVEEALAFLQWSTTKLPGWSTFHKLYAACSELSCRARLARAKFSLGRPGPKTASVVWLEEQARLSARGSALDLVAAFTAAEEKPLTSRLWQAGE